MNNMRVVYDNALERTQLSASSEASAQMSAAKLRIDDKDTLWRATGTSAALRLTWPAPELLGCAALAPCNFSPTATMRVRLTNEAQATNLIRYSEQLDNAAWGRGNTTISPNATRAPDGTMSADKLVDTSASGAHFLFQSVAGFAAGQKFAFSIFAKAGERSIICLRFDASSTALGGESNAYLNLVTGAITGVTGGLTYQVVQLADGWWRFSATGTTAAAGIICPLVMLAASGADYNFTGNGSSGLYAWGAMLNAGALSSYYPATDIPGARPLGYIDGWQSYDYDSGPVACCPAPAVRLRGWTAAQAASAYAYGGGAYARVWVPQMPAVGMAIDIADPSNLQGYLEAACLIAGPYWSPQYNASDAKLTMVDTTELYRKASGAQGADPGFIYRRLPISLSAMPAADRAAFVNIVRNSRACPVLVSLYPGSADAALERDNMVYGRRSKDSDIAVEYSVAHSSTIEVEEI